MAKRLALIMSKNNMGSSLLRSKFYKMASPFLQILKGRDRSDDEFAI
jgi:hypothetical protein